MWDHKKLIDSRQVSPFVGGVERYTYTFITHTHHDVQTPTQGAAWGAVHIGDGEWKLKPYTGMVVKTVQSRQQKFHTGGR